MMMRNTNLAFKFFSVSFSIILIIAAIIGSSAQSQTLNDESDFKIVVESVNNEVKLSCKNGCAWRELSFYNTRIQAIDQYGMTNTRGERQNPDSRFANFLFTIEKTADGVNLTGIEGTLWKELSFTCTIGICNQAIDGQGMTTLN